MYNIHLINEINVDFKLHHLFENEVNRRLCFNLENIMWSISITIIMSVPTLC